MSNPIHIMLDLETWGTEPGCDIRSIGACVFDPVSGIVGKEARYTDNIKGDVELYRQIGRGQSEHLFYIATDNPTKHDGYWRDEKWHDPALTYPLTRNAATVEWWGQQSDEAQAAFADPVDLKDALRQFGEWITQFGSDNSIRLWSHGSAFDPPIFAAAYRATGQIVPWHHRAPRDTRTAFDMAGIDDHSAWMDRTPGPLGIEHHALDDAICQARAVCAAYTRAMQICHQGDRWSPPE